MCLEDLKSFKHRLETELCNRFSCTREEAKAIIRLLEDNDVIRLEAPILNEQKTTYLYEPKSLKEDDMALTSSKIGNIKWNTYVDWESTFIAISSILETAAGFSLEQPLLTTLGVIQGILTASQLTTIKLDENDTSIILALHKNKKHGLYQLSEDECRSLANRILVEHGFTEMSPTKFAKTANFLDKIACIKIDGGNLELIETVTSHYRG